MRPKFRIWDTQEKRWYEPVYRAYDGVIHELNITLKGDLHLRTASGMEHESTFLNRYILVQFTGAHDKNWKAIYEGDILQMGDNPEFVDPVTWSDKFLAWDNGGIGLHEAAQCGVTIVGNIYENPELLKQQTKETPQ